MGARRHTQSIDTRSLGVNFQAALAAVPGTHPLPWRWACANWRVPPGVALSWSRCRCRLDGVSGATVVMSQHGWLYRIKGRCHLIWQDKLSGHICAAWAERGDGGWLRRGCNDYSNRYHAILGMLSVQITVFNSNHNAFKHLLEMLWVVYRDLYYVKL